MTIEESIHRIKDHMAHHGIGIYPHIHIADAMEAALAALREQEERSKGCNWCWHFQNDPQYLVARGNGMYDEVIFGFCPVCGKKLEVKKAHD